MKTERLMQIFKKSLVCTMACFISISYVFSYSSDEEKLRTEEEWNEENKGQNRSSESSTFTIYLNSDILTIQNANPIYDLDITIINNVTSEEVYHTQVNKEASSYIVLPISELGAGQYRLTISNPKAGYVVAYFNL